MIAFTQICFSVEHRLLSVRLHKSSNMDPDYSVYEVVRIAGLICMTYLFRKMNLTSAIFVNLHKRLRATMDDLENASAIIMDEDTMRLLLWAVSVASLTALDQVWFTTRIRWYMLALDIKNVDELSDCLACFVWSSRMALDYVKVWEKVEWPLEELPQEEQCGLKKGQDFKTRKGVE